ncbi:extracellular serine-rich protein [Microthyrium microscopicum]|uniref:Extracellular serine-rich protein n=1 Tax=Microthyrium microscopicum TaxID=703497 RepID=A0A6A6UAZ6_9PEZI|nr:extracellular serine-rich protein [Microthyrium microscopicum]
MAAPAPTLSTVGVPSSTVSLTGVTHTVAAGRAGLHFDPENVVANIGDIVEWHFLPMNHSVAQSSFDAPCVPNANAAFSGFQPIMANVAPQAPNVFQVVVKDQLPFWYYCAQTKGSHCQMGMAGVINQNFNSPNTLTAYKAKAALTEVSVAPPIVGNGGKVIPNPQPLAGI